MDLVLKFLLSTCLCLLGVNHSAGAASAGPRAGLSAVRLGTMAPNRNSSSEYSFAPQSKSGQQHPHRHADHGTTGEEFSSELSSLEKQLADFAGLLILCLAAPVNLVFYYLLKFRAILSRLLACHDPGRPIYLRLCTVRI